MTPGPLVVLGDTLLDTDMEGTTERLCPDAPVPVVDVTAQRRRPGGAGLAALLAAAAGHDVVLVTALGIDPPGRELADLLGAQVQVVRMPLRGSTVCKTRVRAAGQSMLRFDSGDGRAAGGPVDDQVCAALRSAGAVLVADYGRGVTTNPALREVLAEVAGPIPVLWDPHLKGARPVPGCRLATPNEAEVAGLVHGDGAQTTATLRRLWRCDAVAMTLGAHGALLCTAESCDPVPVPDVTVPAGSDTCGAGDAFAAAATGALLDGAGVGDAVTAAVRAASRFVAAGAAAALDVPTPATPTALSPMDIAARLRRRGGRLVATGGCFDLLHPGHLSLLRQARALGDALVVCLNSDDSVRRRKGRSRPIVPAAGRVAMLEALEPVDAVAVFDEDTPGPLLDLLQPDVWVKGGDYTVADLPETAVVHRHGGRVVIIPMLEGFSTSRLVSAGLDSAGLDSAGQHNGKGLT